MSQSKSKKQKTVYIGMVADGLHHGHINIIKEARKLGKVIVGLVVDKAVESYKRTPILKFEERKQIMENIKGVSMVVPQHTLNYVQNILKYRPSIVMHGDDWREGVQKETRRKVKEAVESYGGELVEIPYTKGISTTDFIKRVKSSPDGGEK